MMDGSEDSEEDLPDVADGFLKNRAVRPTLRKHVAKGPQELLDYINSMPSYELRLEELPIINELTMDDGTSSGPEIWPDQVPLPALFASSPNLVFFTEPLQLCSHLRECSLKEAVKILSAASLTGRPTVSEELTNVAQSLAKESKRIALPMKEIFMILFNYGVDCTNPILSLISSAQVKELLISPTLPESKSQPTPENWQANLATVFDGLSILLKTCQNFDSAELVPLVQSILIMFIDFNLNVGLLDKINCCLETLLDCFNDDEFLAIVRSLASAFMAMAQMPDYGFSAIYKVADRVPLVKVRCLELRTALCAYGLTMLCNDPEVISCSSKKVVSANELSNLLKSNFKVEEEKLYLFCEFITMSTPYLQLNETQSECKEVSLAMEFFLSLIRVRHFPHWAYKYLEKFNSAKNELCTARKNGFGDTNSVSEKTSKENIFTKFINTDLDMSSDEESMQEEENTERKTPPAVPRENIFSKCVIT